MAQYDVAPPAGQAGLEYDISPKLVESYKAEGAFPFGVALVQGTAAGQAKEPAAASLTSDFLGISMRTHAASQIRDLTGDDAVADEEMVNVLSRGRLWVRVEHAVTRSDRVYFRSTVGGSEQAGEFRADGDGTAKVTTVTPTAANSTDYRLQLKLDDGRSFEYEITSDGNATEEEICDALRTAIDASAPVTEGLITTSGTTTLILTGDKGVDFQVTSSDSAGTLAVALTTALDSDCVFLPQAKYVVGGSSLAVVQL